MNKLIERRTRKGHNPEQSTALLQELIESHTGDNLEYALVYNDFATETGAQKFVAQLTK